jgi:F0F1-type ATP synthase membrane subunit a
MTVWKLFDVLFIGSIQAFIFMLLTIIYFGQAREGAADEGREAPSPA